MRLLLFLAALLLLVSSTLAWTKEDYEIFDLVSAIEKSEGKGTTFYSWLDVPPTASTSEISKAYRRKSIRLHPDKNRGVKDAHNRFARLGTVVEILRSSEKRERYDFFFKNGVPKWRGTGYYYSRYRPGLGSVFVFLIVSTSSLHYFIQRINYKNDLARIDRFVREARLAAWGQKMVPLEGQRKVRISMGGRAGIDEEGNAVQRTLEMVVEGNEVFIVEPDGQLLPLDNGAASPPSFRRTWFIALVLSTFRKFTGKGAPEQGSEVDSEDTPAPSESSNDSKKRRKQKRAAAKKVDDDSDLSSSEAPSSGVTTPVMAGKPMSRGPTIMAGGRRRKGAPPPPRKRPEKKEAEASNDS